MNTTIVKEWQDRGYHGKLFYTKDKIFCAKVCEKREDGWYIKSGYIVGDRNPNLTPGQELVLLNAVCANPNEFNRIEFITQNLKIISDVYLTYEDDIMMTATPIRRTMKETENFPIFATYHTEWKRD